MLASITLKAKPVLFGKGSKFELEKREQLSTAELAWFCPEQLYIQQNTGCFPALRQLQRALDGRQSGCSIERCQNGLQDTGEESRSHSKLHGGRGRIDTGLRFA